jgi:gamma-glutamylcyclotransferase (GGCT)/AIG2-like uncharacterized protein YtfP
MDVEKTEVANSKSIQTDEYEYWSEAHQGFPWYMDEEDIRDEKADVQKLVESSFKRAHFTPDFPKLNREAEHYIFVYGTLKRNKSNHRVIEKNSRYVTTAFTADKSFIMKETKGGHIPVVLGTLGDKDQSQAARVQGEVYLVPTSMMERLDEFEQNGVLYRRAKLCVNTADKQRFIAWTYLGIKTAWINDVNLGWAPKWTTKKDKDFHYYCYAGLPLANNRG